MRPSASSSGGACSAAAPHGPGQPRDGPAHPAGHSAAFPWGSCRERRRLRVGHSLAVGFRGRWRGAMRVVYCHACGWLVCCGRERALSSRRLVPACRWGDGTYLHRPAKASLARVNQLLRGGMLCRIWTWSRRQVMPVIRVGSGRHLPRQLGSADRARVVAIKPRQDAVAVEAVPAVQLCHRLAREEAAVTDGTRLSGVAGRVLGVLCYALRPYLGLGETFHHSAHRRVVRRLVLLRKLRQDLVHGTRRGEVADVDGNLC
mmetsp:Transcript_29480/g.76204  ORF Transcript_29480/g.76204 Transcript_29480/m.76204 type:complete len:260 (-) Transcript_29480:715-1494(-)